MWPQPSHGLQAARKSSGGLRLRTSSCSIYGHQELTRQATPSGSDLFHQPSRPPQPQKQPGLNGTGLPTGTDRTESRSAVSEPPTQGARIIHKQLVHKLFQLDLWRNTARGLMLVALTGVVKTWEGEMQAVGTQWQSSK